MIFEGIYYILEFLNYYLVYRVVFNTQFTQKKGRMFWTVMGLCASYVVLLSCVTKEYGDTTMIFMALLAIILLVEKDRKKSMLLFPVVFCFSSFVNVLGSYLLAYIMNMSYSEFIRQQIWVLISECTGILFFGVCSLGVFKKIHDQLFYKYFRYMVMVLEMCCLILLVGFSQGILQEGQSAVYLLGETTAVGIIFLALILVLLSIWQQMSEKRAYEYQLQNKKYENYIVKQEAHIQDIIESDEKIRRFRHDMHAHIIALDMCIQKEDMNGLKQYILGMKQEIQNYEVYRFTGITAADAIISEWYKKAQERKIVWNWSGKLILGEKIEIYDVCIIFSNLLSNAVEAIERIEGSTEKIIDVHVENIQNYVCIKVCNSCREDVKSNEGFVTSKKDKRNHGFGIENINRIIEKYHGKVIYRVINGMFQVEIII